MKMPDSNTSIDHIAKSVGIDKPVEVIDCAYVIISEVLVFSDLSSLAHNISPNILGL